MRCVGGLFYRSTHESINFSTFHSVEKEKSLFFLFVSPKSRKHFEILFSKKNFFPGEEKSWKLINFSDACASTFNSSH